MTSFQRMNTVALGQMNKPIQLQKETVQTGAGGRMVSAYQTIESLWAAVSSRYHAPVVRADKVDYPVTINFITHNLAQYKNAKRIVWQDRIFEILGFDDPDGDDRYIEFKTREIKA